MTKPIRSPITAKYTVDIKGFEVMAHAPEAQPMNL